MTYKAPIADLAFLHRHLLGLQNIGLIGFDVSDESLDDILSAAGSLAEGSFAPLNQSGDKEGCKLVGGQVQTPQGFKEAYKEFIEGGWNAVSFDEKIGGMGLPTSLNFGIQEMFQSANMGLALATLLNQGAIELLSSHGDETIKSIFLPNLVSGKWTGTMNLTEPQAGSDLNAIRTIATPDGGYHRLRGQKIFISYGDHDMAENILHFVLARLPDAPEGAKNLSLFLVPKILVKRDGELGDRNDVNVVSLEHKLGQHGSPTCVMSFGDNAGAIGYMIGKPNAGLEAMFTMMNNARLGVGIQGLAIADRAYQQAVSYAKERKQGYASKDKSAASAIIEHADVRRMLMTMRAQIEACRALGCVIGHYCDRDHMSATPDGERKTTEHRKNVELLTPIFKAWATDMANEVTNLNIQVHGGMGYIEESGAPQHMRDARVLSIYEGTNGIQALDLVMRKVAADNGDAMFAMCNRIKRAESDLLRSRSDSARLISQHLAFARTDLELATKNIIEFLDTNKKYAIAAAPYYLQLAGITFAGTYLSQSAANTFDLYEAWPEEQHAFLKNKETTARFYAEHIMPRTSSLRTIIEQGHASLYDMPNSYFD